MPPQGWFNNLDHETRICYRMTTNMWAKLSYSHSNWSFSSTISGVQQDYAAHIARYREQTEAR